MTTTGVDNTMRAKAGFSSSLNFRVFQQYRRDLVEKPAVVAAALFVVATVSEVKLGFFASCGEDRGREGDELRQFPEILGGGGQ